MRRLIKGIAIASLIGAGFFCGFNAEILRDLPHTAPRATLYRLEAAPSALMGRLSRLARPTAAHAADESASLDPTETYLALLNTIRQDYQPPTGGPGPDTVKLTEAGINGMLVPLNDRYTEYWTPKEYRDNMQETAGVFAGVGITVEDTTDGKMMIVECLDNSPAARKGVLPGDVLLAVDGRPLKGLMIEGVMERIKGEPGTKVSLTIERKGLARPFVLALVRDYVQTNIVHWRMEDEANKIGYIQLEMFNEQADQQFATAVSRLEKKGMRGLIFDLRGNPGGLFDIAQDLASRFLAEGTVVWVKEKNGQTAARPVSQSKHVGKLSTGAYPVVVLVDGGSASASEIVAGAIKDSKAGTLIGSRTFGKGLVQTIFPLADDSAVKVTTQHYFTPNKIDINKRYDTKGKQIGGGIEPDIDVPLTDKDYDKMQAARRANPRDKRAGDKFDAPLQKGVAFLKEHAK